ncbi:MAG: pilin [Patescibacteria group bacterium]
MKKIILTALFIILGSFILLPTTVFATDDYGLTETAKQAGIPTESVEPTKVASAIINTVLGIVGVLAVVMIIYGGFLWLTSGGNEEKLSQAKTLLQNVVIGLFIILASYAIANFIVSSLKKATGGKTTITATTCQETLSGASCKNIADCGAYIISTDFETNKASCTNNSDKCKIGLCLGSNEIVCCKAQ